MLKTKLLFTLGPATDRPGVLRDLIAAGMNGARLNFSHGTREEHARRFHKLHAEAARARVPVATLLDLSGPKLRVGTFPNGRLLLVPGAVVRVVPGVRALRPGEIPVSYPHLAKDLKRGSRILLDDGLLELRVKRAERAVLYCEVVTGGELLDHKGFNVPEAALRVPALTAKDKQDLSFGLRLGVDWVALSFVRHPREIHQLKHMIKRAGSPARVIAKLEKPQAIEHLEEIIKAADGVMVARGDLGVEMSPAKVPMLQKRIIAMAHEQNRLVITATQMLQSMMENPAPTRAEASDVANAIFDGTDAVMLSGETAAGKYPAAAARMMALIAGEAEGSPQYNRLPRLAPVMGSDDALVSAAVELAKTIQARALAVFTQSGNTARLVSRRRPRTPLLVFAHSQSVQRQLSLHWGIHSLRMNRRLDTEALLKEVERRLRAEQLVKPGETVVVLASSPVANRAHVNFLKVQVMG